MIIASHMMALSRRSFAEGALCGLFGGGCATAAWNVNGKRLQPPMVRKWTSLCIETT